MASRKQVEAAKRNIKKARRAASAKRTIANLPLETRRDLGRQAAKARDTTTRTGPGRSCTRWPRERASPAGRRWASGI